MSFSLQKANFWKRISAYMLDTVLLITLVMGLVLAMSAILKCDYYIDEYTARQNYHATEIGVNINISNEDYEALTEAEKTDYDAKYEQWEKALQEDEQARKLAAQRDTRLLISVTVSILLGDLILYFAVPLAFKNGQTLGKKVFGLAVIRSNGVKVTAPVLFIRSMIGLYVIETMFPFMLVILFFAGVLGIVGLITLALLGILQIAVMIMSRTNSCIHDLLTDTVVVDFASQIIYETQEELIEQQKAEAAEKAAQTEHSAQ